MTIILIELDKQFQIVHTDYTVSKHRSKMDTIQQIRTGCWWMNEKMNSLDEWTKSLTLLTRGLTTCVV